ncbi:SHOCT domain-containing protein [Ornithinimicrobium sp. LYQ92]|uniref:SHOCT domain-containing protein n=1 Tax=Serinicoccus sp. LYQ92 TaxID=3378798 RepID=UPI0038526610
MKEIVGLPGEESAYRDPKVRKGMLKDIRLALRRKLLPGETVQGLFIAYRIRRSVSALVVTDRRLLTLGDVSVGMPVVDDLDRSQVTEVTIERHKVFSTGAVVAVTPDGPVGLGTLDYGKETFNKLEEILAQDGSAGMPLIPTPSARRPGVETVQDGPQGHLPLTPPAGGVPPQHPLVAQLSALADLHERGALDDDEFAAAKQKLIAEWP